MRTLFFLVIALLFATTVLALDLPLGVQRVIAYQQHLALSITLLVAFVGGLLTFTSPCGFVLLPTFLACMFQEKKKALVMTLFFSVGLVTAFMFFGVVAVFAGSFFSVYKEASSVIAGLVLIFFGCLLALGKGFAGVQFRMGKKPVTRIDTLLLGFFFAVGWTPCVGPILGGVGLLAGLSGSVLKSVVLFGAYALGVVVPLLVISYWSDRKDVARFFTSKPVSYSLLGKRVQTSRAGIFGGLVLASIGVVMVLDRGTSVFMEQIPQYVPWRMDFFVNANEWLVNSAFFTSRSANVVGGLVVVFVLAVIVWQVRKAYKE